MNTPLTYKYFTLNTEGRDFVVGDIHGCISLLRLKMISVDFDTTKDRMFSVGDLIDRGPNSLDCLKLITEDWFHAVRGNHEDMMIGAMLHNGGMDLWMMNGGQWIIDADRESPEDMIALIKVAENLPYAMTIETKNGTVGICHAQPPSFDWKDTVVPSERDITTMLWARTWIGQTLSLPKLKGVDKSYHGHTIITEPLTLDKVNFIDTGAFHTGVLTMVQL